MFFPLRGFSGALCGRFPVSGDVRGDARRPGDVRAFLEAAEQVLAAGAPGPAERALLARLRLLAGL